MYVGDKEISIAFDRRDITRSTKNIGEAYDRADIRVFEGDDELTDCNNSLSTAEDLYRCLKDAFDNY
jgi:hypothetical protein